MRAFAAVVVVGLAAAAAAQSVKETLEITRQAVETQRRVLVAGALPLTDAEAKAFWPLYDDYEKKRRPIDERANRLVADFVGSGTTAPPGRRPSPQNRNDRKTWKPLNVISPPSSLTRMPRS